jgi:hypothetical protein
MTWIRLKVMRYAQLIHGSNEIVKYTSTLPEILQISVNSIFSEHVML